MKNSLSANSKNGVKAMEVDFINMFLSDVFSSCLSLNKHSFKKL